MSDYATETLSGRRAYLLETQIPEVEESIARAEERLTEMKARRVEMGYQVLAIDTALETIGGHG